jgi:hypothetical protein
MPPIAPLPIPAEQLTMLAAELSDLLDDLEDQHDNYLKRIEVWRTWYHATPLQTTRTIPFNGASNVVIPVIRWHSDAVSARYLNTIFAREDQVWIAKSSNEQFRKRYLPHLPDFMNWAANGNDFDLMTPCSVGFSDLAPLGSMVLALSWRERDRWVFMPEPTSGSDKRRKPKPVKVSLGRGPYVEHVRREDILWQIDHPLQDSDIVARRYYLTWNDIMRNVQTAGWDAEAADRCKGMTANTGRSHDSRERRLIEHGLTSGRGTYETYDFREIWVDWPILRGMKITPLEDQEADEPAIPILVTLCRDAREIVRAVPKPYLIPGWPFYHAHRVGSEQTAPEGLAKILEQSQRAASTTYNQAVDAMTLANAIFMVTNNPQHANSQLHLGRPIVTPNPTTDVVFPTLAKHVTPDIAMMNLVLGIAERLSGINDPNLGKEIRLGGHPSPATSTLTLLNESRELLRASGRIIRRELGRLGEDAATLYQQFEADEGKIVRALGDSDAEPVREWIFPTDAPIAGQAKFDLRALSDVHNPDIDLQRAVMVDQVVGNYYSRVLQALTIANDQRVPPAAQDAALQSLGALTKSFSRVLEAAEVDEVEDFLHKINQNQGGREPLMEEMQRVAADRLGRVAQSGNGRPLPPVSGGAASLPVGGNGTTGQGFGVA